MNVITLDPFTKKRSSSKIKYVLRSKCKEGIIPLCYINKNVSLTTKHPYLNEQDMSFYWPYQHQSSNIICSK